MTGLATQTMVDLSQVRQEERSSRWRQAVPDLFPGMRLDHCPEVLRHGSVQHTRLGGSHAWLIDSSPLRVQYHPADPRVTDPARINTGFLSIMLQLQGSTRVSQSGRECSLGAGSLCFLDNRASFSMEVDHHHSRFLAWQLPREAVLRQHPHFERLTACRFADGDHSADMISHHMLQTLRTSAHLKPHQQAVALNSFIQLLGMLEVPGALDSNPGHWRMMQALSAIDEHSGDPGFTADHVAAEQHISRRQLDRMFQETLGMTVTARIWERRLEHAAELLRDPAHALRSITDIAHSCGFEDAAHFTRAFKKARGLTPRAWRNGAA